MDTDREKLAKKAAEELFAAGRCGTEEERRMHRAAGLRSLDEFLRLSEADHRSAEKPV